MTDGAQILVVALVVGGLVALVYWRRRLRASEGPRSQGADTEYEKRPPSASSSSVAELTETPTPPSAERARMGSLDGGVAAEEIPITGDLNGGEKQRPSSPAPHAPSREPIDTTSEGIRAEGPSSGRELAVGEEEPLCGGEGAEAEEQIPVANEEAPESEPVVALPGADAPHQSEPVTGEVAPSNPSLEDLTPPTASPGSGETTDIRQPSDRDQQPPVEPVSDQANGLPATEGEKGAPEEQCAAAAAQQEAEHHADDDLTDAYVLHCESSLHTSFVSMGSVLDCPAKSMPIGWPATRSSSTIAMPASAKAAT